MMMVILEVNRSRRLSYIEPAILLPPRSTPLSTAIQGPGTPDVFEERLRYRKNLICLNFS